MENSFPGFWPAISPTSVNFGLAFPLACWLRTSWAMAEAGVSLRRAMEEEEAVTKGKDRNATVARVPRARRSLKVMMMM